jgi:hypothetical protein
MRTVDLSGVPVVDAHTHPYRLEDLLARPSEGFDTRITFMGESFLSSSKLDPALAPAAERYADSTVLALVLRRWLAQHLGCEPSREAVTAARDAALRADPVAYTKRLLDAEHVEAILSDEGFPQPPITPEEFEAAIGATVHRVTRLEPWVVEHRGGSFDELVEGVEHEARTAAEQGSVAFKTIVAYRSGLDVGSPTAAEAAEAFAAWRDAGFPDRDRGPNKTVRDFLLHRLLDVARELDRPVHIHCGAGDPDIDLAHAGPVNLWPLLVEHQHQAIVLIHTGYPWIPEAAYLASVLPNVHLELSELVPWGWSMVEWALETILGTAPAAKVLHGSDEAGEPEMFWLAARLTRRSLERVLARFVERDDLTTAEAEAFGRMVLGDNTRRVHGLG